MPRTNLFIILSTVIFSSSIICFPLNVTSPLQLPSLNASAEIDQPGSPLLLPSSNTTIEPGPIRYRCFGPTFPGIPKSQCREAAATLVLNQETQDINLDKPYRFSHNNPDPVARLPRLEKSGKQVVKLDMGEMIVETTWRNILDSFEYLTHHCCGLTGCGGVVYFGQPGTMRGTID